MRIIVDAMGSDACPAPDVEGAVLAAREYGDIEITLVGEQAALETELRKHNTLGLKIDIVHSDSAVTMEDKPSEVLRTKPDSSMATGLNLVKEGQGDAFVTAGNTGAVLAFATLQTLKRMEGVLRPTFPAVIPIPGGNFILADGGGNADCRPEWLVQFGVMCTAYARRVLKKPNPTVALLSNGEEEGKGNELIRKTAVLMEASSLNYIGNIEPKDALRGGADIVIADGLLGNVFLKTLESMATMMFDLLREQLKADTRSKIGGALARPAFRRVYKQVDPFEYGGAPLLGVNGVVIVGHGRSNAKAIKNAINQGRLAAENDILGAIREGMAAVNPTP